MKMILFAVFVISFFGCKSKYRVSEKNLMDLYTIGYKDGYSAAQKRVHTSLEVNDSLVTIDYSNRDTVLTMDSLRVSKILFP